MYKPVMSLQRESHSEHLHITDNSWPPSISPLHSCGQVAYYRNYYSDVERYFAEVYNSAETRDGDNPPRHF